MTLKRVCVNVITESDYCYSIIIFYLNWINSIKLDVCILIIIIGIIINICVYCIFSRDR